jgi:membrane-bound serine protease (ClpP class)
VRRLRALLALALACSPAAALAQEPPAGPVVDVAEVFGVLDRQLLDDAVARVDAANRLGRALLVLQLDTPGAVEADVRRLVERIERSRVPVAVWVGPRRARARSAGALILAAAHIAAIGPSGRIGPLAPLDLAVDPSSARGRREREEARALAARLATARGRGDPTALLDRSLGATASLRAGAVDVVTPSVAGLLRWADGRTVRTAAGEVALRLRSDEVVVRFLKPGPVRSLLHTLATPALAYVLLLGGAMLMAFELFQPGFGVAGVSGATMLAGAVYGLTILPVNVLAAGLLAVGLALLALDVAVHGLGVPTVVGAGLVAYGSLALFPAPAGALGIPGWLAGVGVIGCLLFFVPIMTVVRRSRTSPEQARAARELVGQPGRVRSVLNPEGFVWVADALWRARSEDGSRVPVGAEVIVTGAEGTLLRVRRA